MIARTSCNLTNTLRITHKHLPFMLMNGTPIKITLRKENSRGQLSVELLTSPPFLLRIPKHSQCQSGYLCICRSFCPDQIIVPLKRTEYPFVPYALRRKNVFCIWKLQLIKCGSLVSVFSLASLGSLICAHITHGNCMVLIAAVNITSVICLASILLLTTAAGLEGAPAISK